MRELVRRVTDILSEAVSGLPTFYIDLERIDRLYAAASERLEPGEKRVAAFEGSLGPSVNVLTEELLALWQAPRLFALTDRRFFALRIGRFTDGVKGLDFSDPRLAVRLVSHRSPSAARQGRLRIRRATGRMIDVNYEQIWSTEVATFTRWLTRDGRF